MPRSQTCPSCLTELGWVRAVPDVHYGLPIVVCPSCERASVRTRHPDIEYWRGVRRFRGALQAVIAKVLLVVMGCGLLALMSGGSDRLFSPGGRLNPLAPLTSDDPSRMYAAVMLLGAAVSMMVLCRLVLLHKRVWVPVVVLAVGSLALLTIDFWFGMIMVGVSRVGGFPVPRTSMPGWPEMMERLARWGMFFGVSMIGLVVAYPFERGVRNSDARRFRRLLRKRRKQRATYD